MPPGQDLDAVLAKRPGPRHRSGHVVGHVVGPTEIADHSPVAWLPRYEREMAQGRPAAALVTVAKGTNDDSPMITMLPRAILVPLMSLGIRAQARQADSDVPLKDLIPTMHQEARLA